LAEDPRTDVDRVFGGEKDLVFRRGGRISAR